MIECENCYRMVKRVRNVESAASGMVWELCLPCAAKADRQNAAYEDRQACIYDTRALPVSWRAIAAHAHAGGINTDGWAMIDFRQYGELVGLALI